MKLTWYGHACWKLESACGSVVIDPYENGSVPGLRPLELEADMVLCSHGHFDHNYTKAVKLTGAEARLGVEALPGFHDEKRGALRGLNIMHLISDGETRVAHLGDIGCPPEPEQLEALKGADVLLIPVGGFFTIDGKAAHALAEELGARVVVPMHYRTPEFGLTKVASPEEFLKLRGNVRRYDTNSLTVTPDTPAQTAVLKYL